MPYQLGVTYSPAGNILFYISYKNYNLSNELYMSSIGTFWWEVLCILETTG